MSKNSEMKPKKTLLDAACHMHVIGMTTHIMLMLSHTSGSYSAVSHNDIPHGVNLIGASEFRNETQENTRCRPAGGQTPLVGMAILVVSDPV